MSDRSLIDELLADQQSLTAVEKFSRAHDALAPGAQNSLLRPFPRSPLRDPRFSTSPRPVITVLIPRV